ncbi:MAG TPA: tetratricopeptide repeat protein [Candidatus Sulfotelmatobacter sp.]|nr:tetratricopeptide repeat protein [Candidatus Sulfotelmatobacter sp.]
MAQGEGMKGAGHSRRRRLALGFLTGTALMLGAVAWAQSDDARKCLEEKNVDLAIHYCTRAIRSGQLSDQELASAFHGRGIAYGRTGDYDRAIQDFDQALRLNPNLADALNNRGVAYQFKGDYDRAIQDFDQALRLNPNHADAFTNRARVRFYQGKFREAVPDFAKAVGLVPNDPYTIIGLYLAQARAGQDGRADLTRNAARLSLKEWPAPVVSLYLGSTTPQAVLDAAKAPDARRQREQECEAYFYVGQHHLIQGRKDEAIRMFRASVATGVTIFVEYEWARAELSRLGN